MPTYDPHTRVDAPSSSFLTWTLISFCCTLKYRDNVRNHGPPRLSI